MNIEQMLNQQIANWNVLSTKLRRFHWYVKGPQFFILHEKFEELYNEASAYVDEAAERLLIIGGKPVASMSDYLALATISENGEERTGNEMIKTLINDYSVLAGNLKEAVKAAEDSDDQVTADLFITALANIEKHIWMFRASLSED